MRRLLMALVFSFSLGCMGAFNGLTGLDLDMQMGESAVHPADFVVQPVQGEKLFSMGMTADAESANLPDGVDIDLSQMDEVRIDLVSYKVTDMDAAVAKAVSELQSAGYDAQSTDDPTVAAFTHDGTVFAVVQAEDGGDSTLTLVRVVPRQAPADAAPDGAE